MDLEFTTKQKALLFLNRTYFLYFDAKTSQILRANIAPTSVLELEVLNEDEIRTLIKTFVQTNSLSQSILTILLSEQILFYKQIPQNQEINEQAVKEFIDAVPFEDVGYRVFTLENGHLIVATNKDLYMNIKEAFDELGFEVRFVLPSVLVESVVPGVSREIDEDKAKRVLAHYEKTKEFNMLDIFISESSYKNGEESRRFRLSTLQILLTVLAVLIVVLVVLVFKK